MSYEDLCTFLEGSLGSHLHDFLRNYGVRCRTAPLAFLCAVAADTDAHDAFRRAEASRPSPGAIRRGEALPWEEAVNEAAHAWLDAHAQIISSLREMDAYDQRAQSRADALKEGYYERLGR